MTIKRTALIASLVLAAAVWPAAFLHADKIDDELGEIERRMLEEGDYLASAAELEEMIEADPDDARIYLSLGIARYGMMDYTGAYECMKKAEGTGTRSRKDLAGYAIKSMDANRDLLWDMQAADRALAASSPGGELLKEKIAEGHVRILTGMLAEKYYYPAFITAHIRWLEANAAGDMRGLYRVSAAIYYSAMMYEKAADEFRKAIEEGPADGELLKAYADCLVARGDFDKAGEYYEKAADVYRGTGNKEDASRAGEIEKVKLSLPRSYEDVSQLIQEGRFDEAEAVLRRRLSLNAGDYVAVLQLGQIRWEKGQRGDAVKFYQRAIRMAPDYPTAHLYLGKAYAFQKDMKKAVQEFNLFEEKMERLPPMDEETVDLYVSALHYISYIHSIAKEYTRVVKVSEKILKIRPDDQDAHYNLAIAYYYLGKISRAYDELRKTVDIDPSSAAADLAEYCIEYIRSNPDPRLKKDFSFLSRD